MESIPEECIFRILAFLDLSEIKIFLSTSSYFWLLCQKPRFWQTLIRHHHPEYCQQTWFVTQPKHLFMLLSRCHHVQWMDYEMSTFSEDVIWGCILGYYLYTCQRCNVRSLTYHDNHRLRISHLEGSFRDYIHKYTIVSVTDYFKHKKSGRVYCLTLMTNKTNHGFVYLEHQPSSMMLSIIKSILPLPQYRIIIVEYSKSGIGAKINERVILTFTKE